MVVGFLGLLPSVQRHNIVIDNISRIIILQQHFKGITSTCHASAIAGHVTSTSHNLKWDYYEILAKRRSDTHCKIKETLLIHSSLPLNDNVSCEELYLCQFASFICKVFSAFVIIIVNYLLI